MPISRVDTDLSKCLWHFAIQPASRWMQCSLPTICTTSWSPRCTWPRGRCSGRACVWNSQRGMRRDAEVAAELVALEATLTQLLVNLAAAKVAKDVELVCKLDVKGVD